MNDSAQSPSDPNADLASMDFVALSIEYERLKDKGRRAATDSTRDIVQALNDDDLRRLTAIIQIKRRLSGGQPKESGAKKPGAKSKASKPAADTNDLMNL